MIRRLKKSPYKPVSSWLSVGTNSIAAFLGGLMTLLPSQSAFAQEQLLEGSINVQRFNPAPGPRNFVTTRGARTDGDNAFSFGAMGSFGNDPFVVTVNDEDGNPSDTKVIEVLVSGHLLASYTPIPRLQLGLSLPITYVKGHGIDPTDGAPAILDGEGIDTTALSDPELEVKYRAVGEVDAPFVFGAAGFVTAPLGEATAEGSYIGSDSVGGGVRLIADGSAGPLVYGANLGYRFKDEGRVGNAEFGSEGFYGVAAGVGLGRVFRVVVDLFGSSAFSEAAANATEVNGAFQIVPPNSPWTVTAGAGAGLAQGSVGVPGVRAFAGVIYTAEAKDPDGDGILDSDDLCPTEPEDKDGFQDADGCPDADNDGDAIEDSADKCPNAAEDLDKYQDTDGCPEKDNDGDGIPDVSDRCPDEKENMNGFEDEDGCEDVPDRDNDGVPDDKDSCPEKPEDTDGFEDTDGCPDPDNDGDGIPDIQDECVDQPEDMNGEEDEDGCPEDE